MIKFFGHCTVTGLIGGVLLGAMLSASIAASTTIDTRVPIVDLPDFTQLVEEKLSGVVQLQVSSKVAEASVVADEEISDDDGNPIAVPAPKVDSGSGSGFIISDDGYVVTNAHVVEGKDGLGEVDIIITLSDRREFKGELIGFDQPSDVALVKIIDGTNLPVVTLGDSSKVSPGQWAIAIGQPFGFENTITAGIISSINRYLPSDAYIEYIQTDVAINPGNSGGPLFDVYGDVIGINSQIYSRTGTYSGITFAIPINIAENIIAQIHETGEVSRGRLGVQIRAVTHEEAKELEMNPRTGVFIDDVVPGGPGDIAGIEPNDIILSVNGKEVYHPGMLQLVIGNTAPGDTVQLAITRDGVTIILPTVIGLLKTAAVQEVEAMEATTLGMLVGERSSDSALTYGVAVEKVSEESVAALAGITEGDALLSINGENITGVEHYEQIVETLRAGTSVVAIVKSGDFVQFKTLVIPE